MTGLARIRFGKPPGAVVEIALHGRAVTDPEDWLHAEVTISAGAFSGSYFTYLRVAELRAFRDGRSVLAADDVQVRLGPDGRGTTTACDEAGHVLTCSVAVDLDGLADELDAVLGQFAVRP